MAAKVVNADRDTAMMVSQSIAAVADYRAEEKISGGHAPFASRQ